MKSLFLALAALPATLTQAQSPPVAYVQWGDLSAVPNIPACGTNAFTVTSNATQLYTIECLSNGVRTVIRSGAVTATGSGACPGNGNYCTAPVNGDTGPAPTFYPSLANVGSFWQIWLNAGSNTLSGPANGPYTCGVPNVSAGQVATETKPACPVSYPPGWCLPKCGVSPIIIDTTGEGFYLTDEQHGVTFRELTTGPPQRMSWTDPAHHNAWLVRPDPDGSVRSVASNLFGNLSPQPPSDEANGYLALAYLAEQSGCGKVLRLDSTCSIWGELRLWQDRNQDGIAQPEELRTLEQSGIEALSLKYRELKKVDPYGNRFRYAANVLEADRGTERSYDVFLITADQ
jgi:hypothetical protein